MEIWRGRVLFRGYVHPHTHPHPPYPTEKVGDSPYPYPYPVNAGISRQNGDEFGQYPRGRVYLPSLVEVLE